MEIKTKEVCRWCKGKGKMTNGTCSNCDGFGYYYVMVEAIKCKCGEKLKMPDEEDIEDAKREGARAVPYCPKCKKNRKET